MKSLLQTFQANSPLFPNDSGFTEYLPSDASAADGFAKLISSGLTSIPIVDNAHKEPICLFSVQHVVLHIVALIDPKEIGKPREMDWNKFAMSREEFKSLTALQLVEQLRQQFPECLERSLAVPHDTSAWDAMQLMVENKAKHAIVYDRVSHHIENVLSSSRLTQFITAAIGDLAIKNEPIGEFPHIQQHLEKPTLTVLEDATVLSAFEMMIKNKVGAIVVVGGDQKVSGVISLSDIKSVGPTLEFFRALGDDVASYLRLVDQNRGFAPGRTERPRVVTIAPEDPVLDALELFGFFKVHHLVVVGARGEPHGVVSALDVLAFVFEACKNDTA